MIGVELGAQSVGKNDIFSILHIQSVVKRLRSREVVQSVVFFPNDHLVEGGRGAASERSVFVSRFLNMETKCMRTPRGELGKEQGGILVVLVGC